MPASSHGKFDQRPFPPQKYDEVWDKIEAIKERVAAEKGFAVRAAGVIDMGG